MHRRRLSAVPLILLVGLLPPGSRAAGQDLAGTPLPLVTSGPQTPPLQLAIIGPARCTLGAPFQYDIVVRNTGSSPAPRVQVEDRLATDALLLSTEPQAEVHEGRLVWTLDSLAPETERRFKVVLQPVREGDFLSRATVTSTATSSLQTLVIRTPLQIRATGPDHLLVGEGAVFGFQVTNPGAVSVRDVVVRDRLPPGLRHSQGEYIETALGTLAPGETKRLALRALAVQAGQFVNEAVVSSGEGAQASVRATILVTESTLRPPPQSEPPSREATAAADLLLEVVDRDDPIEIGAETVYEIRVLNRGPSPCTGVGLTASVPRGMSFEGADGPAAYRVQGQQVFFQPLPQLAWGSEACYHVRVRGRQAGDWRFKVQLSTDQGGRPIEEEQSTRVYGG